MEIYALKVAKLAKFRPIWQPQMQTCNQSSTTSRELSRQPPFGPAEGARALIDRTRAELQRRRVASGHTDHTDQYPVSVRPALKGRRPPQTLHLFLLMVRRPECGSPPPLLTQENLFHYILHRYCATLLSLFDDD